MSNVLYLVSFAFPVMPILGTAFHTRLLEFNYLNMPTKRLWRILESQAACRGQDSNPPRSYLIAPPTQSFELVVRDPQPVQITSMSLDSTFEYVINEDNAPECTFNAVTLVNTVVQTSRLSLARASPNPSFGVQVQGIFFGVH